jgi:thiol-disulfide isomerase/thioredoxin
VAWADVNSGDALPNFRLPTLEGRMLDSQALDNRVVYIDFWASWCTTCRQSFPELNELHHELRNQGVVFIGINTDEDPRLAERFLQQTPVDFLILSDRTHEVVSHFNPKGFPTAYIIGRDGRVHTVKEGYLGKGPTRDLLLQLVSR